MSIDFRQSLPVACPCQWFSPASPTTTTGRHDIAEILLKVALNTKNQNKIKTFNKSKVNLC
jgi:hypothetical protein